MTCLRGEWRSGGRRDESVGLAVAVGPATARGVRFLIRNAH